MFHQAGREEKVSYNVDSSVLKLTGHLLSPML